ncbi:hypothetical protein SAMN05444007_104183 [Cribrihabitans marinus]|uniref:Uncharacterized protein n=1 Tax=Cribrihabitans marinus TaxID=1227549 RepID=A0A1H6XUQ5_9RHOB|nr:hypothetical protein [Cribrihabitans marinus]GGH28075.1 hypothetical protein GCM10010973_16760 [Cribrihabitans marinus]SEJ32759.1 hypothetical protein SAMN05444007_104183 [Cribrihabitans marinus]
MTYGEFGRPQVDPAILALIQREQSKALSARELEFRLAGYGYGIQDVAGTRMVTKLPQGTALGILPADLGA